MTAYCTIAMPPKLTFDEGDGVVCIHGRGVIIRKWQAYCNHCNKHHGKIEYHVRLYRPMGPQPAVVVVNHVERDR